MKLACVMGSAVLPEGGIVARIPAWAFAMAAVVFVGLAIWSATDENWSGLIVSGLLAVLCVAGSMRARTPTT